MNTTIMDSICGTYALYRARGSDAKSTKCYETSNFDRTLAAKYADRTQSRADKVYGSREDNLGRTEPAAAASLEDMLKAKYPGLAYHVFDGSSSYWRTRNDYPHYLLYQQNIDGKALEDWKPSGANPDAVSSRTNRALGQLPPGSKAVVIHPKAQERMEQEPEYAREIMARIDAWFAYDLARNEAMIPGSSMGLSQSIVIGEDGEIANVQTSGPSGMPASRGSDDEADDETDFWTARARRNAYYIKLWQEKQIRHGMQVSRGMWQWMLQNQISSSSHRIGKAGSFAAQSGVNAGAAVARMMNSSEFCAALGASIAGVPTDSVLSDTWSQITRGPLLAGL